MGKTSVELDAAKSIADLAIEELAFGEGRGKAFGHHCRNVEIAVTPAAGEQQLKFLPGREIPGTGDGRTGHESRTPQCKNGFISANFFANLFVDGDTFRIGKRRIRIVGIDAPEIGGQCESERRLAAAAIVKLQALLNAGPFVMTGRFDDMKDRYGRDLRVLSRRLAEGTT